MLMSSSTNDHIEITPGVCGGKPRIAGHRIRVQDVVLWHKSLGHAPEGIVGRFPQLTLAEVHAALDYCFDHRDEIQADLRTDRRLADQLKAATPSRLAGTTTVGGAIRR